MLQIYAFFNMKKYNLNLWNPLSAMTDAGLEQGQGEEPSDSDICK